MAFGATVKHARELAAAFNAEGIKAAIVYGAQPPAERQAIMSLWRGGSLQLIANVGCLIEGFDYPELSALILARPTASTGLYLQMLGRVLRTAPAKTGALIFDVVGGSDPRQLRAPELLDAIQLAPEHADHARALAVRRSHRILTRSGLALQRRPGGALFCTVGTTGERGKLIVAVIPDREGTGLYRSSLVEIDRLQSVVQHTPLHDELLPLAESLTHVAPAKNGLSSARAPWRSRPPSEKMHRYLSCLDAATAREAQAGKWNAGVVSEAIDASLLGPLIDGMIQ